MPSIIKKLIFILNLLLLFYNLIFGYYYEVVFTSLPANWVGPLYYGSDSGIHNYTGGLTISYNAQGVTFNGQNFVTDYATADFLKGHMLIYRGSNFNANPYQPFGYTITRSSIRLDPDRGNNPESGRMWASFPLFLVERKDTVVNGSIGAKFDNFFIFMEFYRPKLGSEPDTRPYSYWGINDDKVSGVAVDNLLRQNDAGSTNLSGILTWTYDDYWRRNYYDTDTANSYPSPVTVNDNRIEIRVATDGEFSYLFINPNPHNSANQRNNNNTTGLRYINEYLLITSNRIGFSNSLQPMFGVEHNRPDSELLNLVISNFVIRTICSNVVSEISPYEFMAGASNNLYIVIKPTFESNLDAGIQEFYVDLPASYTNFKNWIEYTNRIGIFWINTNGTVVSTFGKVLGDINPTSGNVAISLKDNFRRLKVRFYAANVGSQVFHPDNLGGLTTANQRAILVVITNFLTPSGADAYGKEFTIYVNNEKYFDTSWPYVATTGKMKSYFGNAMNMSLLASTLKDGDTLTFKTYDNQVCAASVSPGIMYEGQTKVFFYDLCGQNPTSNNAIISRVEIFIPTNFIINTNGNNLRNDRGLPPANLYLSNANNGSNVIVVQYPSGDGLVANNGRDTIVITVVGTPSIPDGTNQLGFQWPSKCYSSLAGTVVSNTITNSIYNSQRIIVRKKPPNATARITATENAALSITNVRNTVISNYYTISVVNEGEIKNDIKRILIKIASEITNISEISTIIPSTNKIYSSNSFLYLEIFYTNTNIPGSSGTKNLDKITFIGIDNVPSLTNKVIFSTNSIFVDNYNGDPATNVANLEIIYYTPPASALAYIETPRGENNVFDTTHKIYTDQDITNIVLIISNIGEEGNYISNAKIYLPPQFVSILSSNSISNASISTTNINGSNTLVLNYTSIGFLKPNTFDIVTFTIQDNIKLSNHVYLAVEIQNNSNYPGNMAITDSSYNMEIIYMYSPPAADAYCEVPNGFINAVEVTNEIKHYVFNRSKSHINKVYINFPDNILTNVITVSNLLGFKSYNYNSGTGTVEIEYSNTVDLSYTQFPGLTNDIIYITGITITNNTNFNFIYSVSNNRWHTNNIGTTPGYSKNVLIINNPTIYSYKVYPNLFYNSSNNIVQTNQLMVIISNRGWGNNNIVAVRIRIPDIFTNNKVFLVSNVQMGLTNDGGNIVVISGSNDIWINYTNNNTSLQAGKMDTNYIWFIVDTNYVGNLSWIVGARNELTPQVTNLNSFLPGGTNKMALVKKPWLYLTTTLFTTLDLFNDYTIKIQDNNGNAGNLIKKVRIIMPANNYTNLTLIGSEYNNLITNYYVQNGSNYLQITYPDGLSGGFDVIKIRVKDNIVVDTTNYLYAEVDYNDGEGWRDVDIFEGTNMMVYYIPPVNAVAYLTPSVTYHDFPTNTYRFYIKNTGGTGNTIKKVKIIAPANIITNCTSLASTVIGAPVLTLDNITNIIFYTNEFELSNNMTDWITLIGWDNVDYPNTNSGTWQVLADNTTEGINETNCNIVPGQTLTLNITRPGYSTGIAIEFTNSITGKAGTNFYSTLVTNYYKFYIYNQSEPDNWIRMVRIKIPSAGNLILTNDYDSSTSVINLIKTTGVTNYLSNDYIVIDYTSNEIKTAEKDELIIRFNDNIKDINTNLTWSADVVYNTTYFRFKEAELYPGKTTTLNYIMPQANARGYSEPNTVSLDFPTNLYRILITNIASEPENNIYLVRISIPTNVITNIDNYTNENTNYNPVFYKELPYLYVYYTNTSDKPLQRGSFDVIKFIGYDNAESANIYTNWEVWVDNTVGLLGSNRQVTAIAGKSFNLNIIQYPYNASAGIEATNYAIYYNINTIYSTVKKSFLKLSVRNDSSADGNNITRIKFKLPLDIIESGTLSIVSSNNGTNIVSGDYATIFYTNYMIPKGGIDDIYISFDDKIMNISTNIDFSDIEAAFDTSYNLFKPVGLWSGKLLNIDYIMPIARARGYVEPKTISEDYPSNEFTIYITNTMVEPISASNMIFRLRIYVPDPITNITDIHNVNGDHTPAFTFDKNNHYLYVYYTNSDFTKGLMTGETDKIVFIGWDSVSNTNYTTNWSIWVDNTTDWTGEQLLTVIPGRSLQFIITKFGYSAKVHLEATNSKSEYERNTIYCTVTTNYLRLFLTNSSSALSNDITWLRIKVPDIVDINTLFVTNLIKTVNVTNYYSNDGYIYVNYSGNNIKKNEGDVIFISFIDKIWNEATNIIWQPIEAAFNTTYNLFKDTTITYGRRIDFDYIMPRPRARASALPNYVSQDFPTNKYVIYITNNASEMENDILYMKIKIPGAINLISNITFSNANYTKAVSYDTNNYLLYIYFTNGNYINGLAPGDTEIIQFIGYDTIDSNSNDYSSVWEVYVDNTTNNVSNTLALETLNGLNLNIIKLPYNCNVKLWVTNNTGNSNTIYTTLITNYVKIELVNSSLLFENISNNLSMLRIKIPWVVNTNTLSVIGSSKTTNSILNDYIVVYYTNLLKHNENDEILLIYNDNVMNISTNVNWSIEAAYDSTYNLFKPVSGNPVLNYLMPDAKAAGYVEPNRVSRDFPTNLYRIIITNTAPEPNNNIYYVKIEIPSAITNIDNINNKNGDYTISYNYTPTYLYIYYTNNSPLQTTHTDVIEFIGYDNIDVPNNYVGNWKVYIDNTTDNTKEKLATVVSGKSYSLLITNYGYRTFAYVEATNFATNSTSIYSTVDVSHIKFVISNSSFSNENKITGLKILIPDIVITNTLKITNLTLPSIPISITNNYIYFDYSSSPLEQNTSNVIIITYNDTISNISTNIGWYYEAAFNTTYNRYKAGSLWPDRSTNIYYIMPEPFLRVAVEPNRISRDYPFTNYIITITNTATQPGNRIYYVTIYPPAAITNLEVISNYNSTYNPIYNYNQISNILTLYYTNSGLNIGDSDKILIKAYDNVDVPDNYYGFWTIFADNTTDNRSNKTTGVIPGKYTSLIITNYNYRVDVYFEFTNYATNPTNTYSTYITNYVKMFVSNSSIDSENKLTMLKIAIPWVVDQSYIGVTNLNRSNVTNFISNNYIYLDYSASNLLNTDKHDEILITYNDIIMNIGTNFVWETEAAFDTTYNRFKPTTVKSGKSIMLAYIMPSVNLSAYSTPNRISRDYPFTNYTIYLSNSSAISGNQIYYVKISIPSAITNITQITNSNINFAPVYYYTGSELYVYYTNDNFTKTLDIGKDDAISFMGYDSIDGENYFGVWQVFGDNTSNFVNPGIANVISGRSLNLFITNYPYRMNFWVVATNCVSPSESNRIYSTVEYNYLIMGLRNTSGSNENRIERVLIEIPWVVVTNTLFVSNLSRTDVTINLSNNYIVLDYSGSNLLQNEKDDIYIEYKDKVVDINTNAIWNVLAQYNTGYDKLIPAIPMSLYLSNIIRYYMPPAKARAYTEPNRISQDFIYTNYKIFITNYANESSNNIYKLTIVIPSALTNLYNITNKNTTYTPIFNYIQSNNLLEVFYPGSGLSYGDYDTIEFIGVDNLGPDSDNYSNNWIIYADNTVSYSNMALAEIVSGKSLLLRIEKYNYRLSASTILTNSTNNYDGNVFYSTLITNYLRISITNTSKDVENIINAVRIKLPSYIVDIEKTNQFEIIHLEKTNNVIDYFTNINSDIYLIMDYENNQMLRNEYDTIIFKFLDKVENIQTNLFWEISARFNTTYDQFKPGSISNRIFYVVPIAQAKGKISPHEVSMYYPGSIYNILITNTSDVYKNNIFIVRINAPFVITNISNIVNLNTNYNPAFYTINSQLIVYYTNNNYNNPLLIGDYDIIQFYAYDTVESNEVKYRWSVSVENTIDGTGIVNITPDYIGAFDVTYTNYRPTFTAYIEVTNGKSKREIYSTAITNELLIYITNNTSITNETYIRYIRILLPTIVDTNYIEVSSLIKNTTNWQINGNYLDIDYSGKVINKNQGDVLYVKFIDKLINITTNINYQIQANFNITYDTYLDAVVPSGKSTEILYIQPNANARVAVEPNNVSIDVISRIYKIEITNIANEINNKIYNIIINIPDRITNLLFISNINNAYNIITSNTGTKLIISYPDGLSTGDYDFIYVRGYDDVTTDEYKTNWNILIDNTTDYSLPLVPLVISGKSLELYIKKFNYFAQAYLIITNSKSIYEFNRLYTTQKTNYLKLYLTNSSFDADNDIEEVRIQLPWGIDFNEDIVINSLIKSSNISINITGSNIVIDYRNNLIKQGEYDEVLIRFSDNIINDTTNVLWTNITAKFSSVDENYVLFTIPTRRTLTVEYEMPRVRASGYITPNYVPEDYPFMNYSLIISNSSFEEGNIIKAIKIIVPDVITNIKSITNRSGLSLVVSNNIAKRELWLIYDSGLNIGEFEQIDFIGYDNISGDTNYSTNWDVWVYNTTDFTKERRINTITDGLLLNIRKYEYTASGYLTLLNNVASGNVFYSTLQTNNIRFRIDNTSPGGYNIKLIKINIPSIYDTNIVSLTANKTGISYLISNNAIWVNFESNMILPGQFGIIDIRILDNIKYIQTNVSWNLFALFDKSYQENYLPVTSSPGRSYTIQYIMPEPSLIYKVSPNEVYLSRTNFVLKCIVSNTGVGSSDIDNINLYIPSILKINVLSNKISNSIITLSTNINNNVTNWKINISYNTNNLLFTATEDIIFIRVTHNSGYTTNVSMICDYRNFIKTNSTEVEDGFSITTVPTFYITPNTIYTTDSSTNIKVYILNNIINGIKPISNVLLYVPSVFTNYSYSGSSVQILGMLTVLTLNYTNNIQAQDYDSINFKLMDNFEIGNITNSFKAYVADEFGYIEMNTESGKSANIAIIMPPSQSESALSPNYIVLTSPTNSFEITISNKGPGYNLITEARILLPTNCFISANNIQSTYGGIPDYNAISNFVVVNYTNLLKVGSVDKIKFNFTNLVNVVTNLYVRVEVANLTNNKKYYLSPGIQSDEHQVQVGYPRLSAEGFFYEENTLYLIEKEGTLKYRIINRSYGTELTQVIVLMPTNIFDSIEVSSEKLPTIQFLSNSNILLVSYNKSQGLNYGEIDDLTMYFKYTKEIITNMIIKSWFTVYGDTNGTTETMRVGNTTNLLILTNSTWGLAKGSIFPGFRPVAVKLYKSGEKNIAISANGKPLSGSSKTDGTYSISRINEGYYDFEFTSPYYKRLVLSNQYIYANTINMISMVTMRNEFLKSGVGIVQEILCYDNTNTKVIFTPNSVKESFSLDIKKYYLTDYQVNELKTNKFVKTPVDSIDMVGYKFELNDLLENNIQGALLASNSILYLAYDKTNDVDRRGWSEDELGIFYWDDNGVVKRWIRIGGKVDKENKFVVAKVNYITGVYAVLGKNNDSTVVGEHPIKNVNVRPKVISPTKDADGYYGSVRISFELPDDVNSYELKIYDANGKLIKSYQRDAEYGQGEIGWDGKDMDGFDVKSGYYIYRIIAGSYVYTGTIIVVR